MARSLRGSFPGSFRGTLSRSVVILLLGLLVLGVGGTAAGQQGGDSAIGGRIGDVFRHIPGLEQVEIGEADGVVTLSGSVPEAADKDLALRLAGETAGVLHVVDTMALEVRNDSEPALMPAVQKVGDGVGDAIAFLPLLGVALVIIVVFWFLAARIPWEAPYRRLGINPLLSALIGQLIRVMIFLLGVLLALDILGATPVVAAVLGSVGLVGLALGFAFRDIVENYLAGILMSLRQPFRQHDHVQIGSHEGRVLRLTSRELVLMMLDGNHLRIPNGTVFKSPIHNFSLNPRRRFDFVVTIKITDDVTYVQELGIETLVAMNGVLDAPGPFARVDSMSASNVTVHFFGWVDQRKVDIGKVKSQVIRLVKEAFSDGGILPPETPRPVKETATPSRPDIESLPTAKREAAEVDVSVDTQLEDQIREDLSHSEEENLLEGDGDTSKAEESAAGPSPT